MIGIDWKGGIVTYDECHLDLLIPLEQQTQALQEDLLHVNYPQNYTLDLGWYPENDPAGQFTIQVIRDHNWDKPRLTVSFRDKSKLKFYLQKAVTFLCADMQAEDPVKEE